MARRDRTDLKPSSALSILLAVLIGVFGALMWVHWMACSQSADVAACMFVSALPARGSWWHRMVRRLRIRWADLQMRQTEVHLAQVNRMLIDDSVLRENLRDLLAEQQRRVLDLRSQP